jgi:hypothetical protein
MAQRVQRPGGEAGLPAVERERPAEPVRVDRPAELVRKHEIAVGVGGAGERSLRELYLAMLTQNADRFLVERDRAPGTRRLRRSKRAAAAGGDELLFDVQAGAVEIEAPPRRPEQFAAPHSRRGGHAPQREETVTLDVFEKARELRCRPRLRPRSRNGGLLNPAQLGFSLPGFLLRRRHAACIAGTGRTAGATMP